MSKSSSHNNDIVQPVYISSEKELTLEFQSFYKYLSDTGLFLTTSILIISSIKLKKKRLIGANVAKAFDV